MSWPPLGNPSSVEPVQDELLRRIEIRLFARPAAAPIENAVAVSKAIDLLEEVLSRSMSIGRACLAINLAAALDIPSVDQVW